MAAGRKRPKNDPETRPPQSAPSPTEEHGSSTRSPQNVGLQFRLLVDSVLDYAIFLLDTEGVVVSWNKGAARIKGYKADEIIGQHFSTFYTPEDRASKHPQEELEIAKREGRYEEEGWRIRKDGSRFIANVVITALFDENGTHCGFAKVTRDITERKKAEESRLRWVQEQVSRSFLRDILFSVTEGRLRFCDNEVDLPEKLYPFSDPMAVTKTSLGSIRNAVLKAAASRSFPKDRSQDMLTAVSEAAMNAAVHASVARCEIYTSGMGDRATIQVWICDKGSGIDLSHVTRATLERGFTTQGGLGHGFWLMLNTSDRIWLLTSPSGTTVVLELDGQVAEPEWLGSRSYAGASAEA